MNDTGHDHNCDRDGHYTTGPDPYDDIGSFQTCIYCNYRQAP